MNDGNDIKLIPGQPIYKRPKPRPAPEVVAVLPSSPTSLPSKSAIPNAAAPGKRTGPPTPADDSGAEHGYLRKHGKARTQMVIVLKSGIVLRGRIEWIDRYSIKIERKPAGPNVLVYKSSIDYIHREDLAAAAS